MECKQDLSESNIQQLQLKGPLDTAGMKYLSAGNTWQSKNFGNQICIMCINRPRWKNWELIIWLQGMPGQTRSAGIKSATGTGTGYTGSTRNQLSGCMECLGQQDPWKSNLQQLLQGTLGVGGMNHLAAGNA